MSLFSSSRKQRVIRVFLSSTFRDFIEERDVLVKRVFPELRRFCRERFVELIEVDLRWGITSKQAARRSAAHLSQGNYPLFASRF